MRPVDLSRVSPRTLRNMAETQRRIARSYERWAADAENRAAQYDDLADAKEQQRVGGP